MRVWPWSLLSPAWQVSMAGPAPGPPPKKAAQETLRRVLSEAFPAHLVRVEVVKLD